MAWVAFFPRSHRRCSTIGSYDEPYGDLLSAYCTIAPIERARRPLAVLQNPEYTGLTASVVELGLRGSLRHKHGNTFCRTTSTGRTAKNKLVAAVTNR